MSKMNDMNLMILELIQEGKTPREISEITGIPEYLIDMTDYVLDQVLDDLMFEEPEE